MRDREIVKQDLLLVSETMLGMCLRIRQLERDGKEWLAAEPNNRQVRSFFATTSQMCETRAGLAVMANNAVSAINVYEYLKARSRDRT